MARSEAQIRAEKKHLEKTKSYHIKFNIYTDANIIAAIELQKNKNGYIKKLIRDDIKRHS